MGAIGARRGESGKGLLVAPSRLLGILVVPLAPGKELALQVLLTGRRPRQYAECSEFVAPSVHAEEIAPGGVVTFSSVLETD